MRDRESYHTRLERKTTRDFEVQQEVCLTVLLQVGVYMCSAHDSTAATGCLVKVNGYLKEGARRGLDASHIRRHATHQRAGAGDCPDAAAQPQVQGRLKCLGDRGPRGRLISGDLVGSKRQKASVA